MRLGWREQASNQVRHSAVGKRSRSDAQGERRLVRTHFCSLSARAKITSGFSESFRRGIVTLPKIRNPKLEIRNKPEGPKSESQNQAASRRYEPWSLRILNLFRVSGFGLRVCRASNGGWPAVRI